MGGPSPFPVRASSWGNLFDCAHRWEGAFLLGIRRPAGLPALLGNAIHAGTAEFDKARIAGSPIKPIEAAAALVNELRAPSQEYDLRDADMSLQAAERLGIQVLTRYCTEIAPRYEFTHVEMPLNPLDINCGHGVVIRLTGTMDRGRVRKTTAGCGIQDVKTGRRAVTQGRANVRKHKAQLGVYELLFEQTTHETVTDDAEILALPTNGDAPAIGAVSNCKAALLGDGNQPGLLQYAAAMFRTGLFPPNVQSQTCSPRYCARFAGCKFHE